MIYIELPRESIKCTRYVDQMCGWRGTVTNLYGNDMWCIIFHSLLCGALLCLA
jgi:hypothetical protein